jgi:hypothetical protein
MNPDIIEQFKPIDITWDVMDFSLPDCAIRVALEY